MNFNTLSASLSPLTSTTGTTAWRSPSNIALVKYWGKRPVQLPQNPSISFTLSKAFSETTFQYEINHSEKGIENLQFYFENQENEPFRQKIIHFFQSILPYFPFLSQIQLKISSFNSFPHSAGIASSASGMSALVLNLIDLEQTFRQQLGYPLLPETEWYQKASYFSRLASGSACRSVYPNCAIWGETIGLSDSSDQYAVPVLSLHPVFHHFQDTILIVSRAEKSVSSRAGHSLMDAHPYATVRYQTARQQTTRLLAVLAKGDVEDFIQIVENEALMLHSLMMTSEPSVILLEPPTLLLIQKIRYFRQKTKIPVCFTIDAGPNIHLLYPQSYLPEVEVWIREELLPLCQNQQIIFDEMGNGATKII